MRRAFLLTSALLATVFFLLVAHRTARLPRSMGLQVQIARAVTCRADRTLGELVLALRPGRVAINSDEMTLDELDDRLKSAFRDGSQRVVFLVGGEDLQFSAVAEVIAIAVKHPDYVSLVTPVVEDSVRAQPGSCLDANINFTQILM
jgi:hypothetical protein